MAAVLILPVSSQGALVEDILLDIQKLEYEIRYQPHVDALQSPNRAQNLRFTYYPDGFAAQCRAPETEEQASWRVSIRVLGLGRGDQIQAANWGDLTSQDRRAEAHASGIVAEYLNSEEGMRQNFYIASRPGQRQGPVRLLLVLELDNAAAETTEAGDGLIFYSAGSPVMKYDGLLVWDANGTVLPAAFEPRGDHNWTITVDDKGAVYPITVDPLASAMESGDGFPTGPATNSRFGFSVADAGDVNASGYGGIIVGAPYFDGGQTDEGKVFVFYGAGTGLDRDADWSVESNYSYAHFGWSVASGKLKTNTVSAVVIGAPDWDTSDDSGDYTDDGRVFVWYTPLPANPNPNAPDWGLSGHQDYASLGYAVANAGHPTSVPDYDGIIIGAPNYDYTYTDTGAAYVFIGSGTGLPSSATWSVYTYDSYANFGFSVAAGKTHSSTYSDIIIGAPNYHYSSQAWGYVFVFHGSSSGLPGGSSATTSNANKSIYGGNDSKFGYSVASGFDEKNDTYEDVLVGAPYDSNGQTQEGRAFVFTGSSSGIATTNSWSAESNQAYAHLGWSVAGYKFSVITNDQGVTLIDDYGDIAIGSPDYDAANSNDGRCDVWKGSANGFAAGTYAASDYTTLGNGANNQEGYSVAFANKVYYGGRPCLLVGKPGDNTNTGSVGVWKDTP